MSTARAGATPEQMYWVPPLVTMPSAPSSAFLLGHTAQESFGREVWCRAGRKEESHKHSRSRTNTPQPRPAASAARQQPSPLGIFSFLHGAPNNRWSAVSVSSERVCCSALSYLIILLGFYPKNKALYVVFGSGSLSHSCFLIPIKT